MPTAGLKAEVAILIVQRQRQQQQRLGLLGASAFAPMAGAGSRGTARRRFFLRHAVSVVRRAWVMLWKEWRERKFLRAARGSGEYEVVVIFGMGMERDDGELWILGPRRERGMDEGCWWCMYGPCSTVYIQ